MTDNVSDPEPIVPASVILEWFGGVSSMTLYRWIRREIDPFPPPDYEINNVRYWRASTVHTWRERQRTRPANKHCSQMENNDED